MKQSKVFALLATLLVLLIIVVVCSAIVLFNDSDAIAFESRESKTPDAKPIFNRVAFYPSANRDVWVMQQSHSGYYEEFEKWDRIAIVVDKTVEPKTAKYFQLEPGEAILEVEKKKSLKVSCFLCHANGPRAIRANFDSEVNVSIKDRLKLAIWNLRIKTYGKVAADDSPQADSDVPLKLNKPFDNESLTVKTCVKCHSESGFLARGSLKRQHFMSIKFLVESGEMPPPGYRLPPEDRAKVLRFARGL